MSTKPELIKIIRGLLPSVNCLYGCGVEDFCPVCKPAQKAVEAYDNSKKRKVHKRLESKSCSPKCTTEVTWNIVTTPYWGDVTCKMCLKFRRKK